MLGLILTLLFSIGAAGIGLVVFRKLTSDLDPALAIGINGLTGLAVLGVITLPIALLPGGARWGVYVVGLIALCGYWPLFSAKPSSKTPSGFQALILLAAVLALLCGLVGVLSPSDSFDWDTLAYHLAVPKIWIEQGSLSYVSFIHQSNFPLTVDGLYIWGLDWGGMSSAKAFSLCFAVYGAIALFGFGRSRFGALGGWWTLLAYLGIPMVAWESGTGYIDVSNGLFVGLGVLFAASYAANPKDRRCAWLAGVFLGFAAGSKYTGLQTIIVVAVVLLAYRFLSRDRETQLPSVRATVLTACLALVIASPWYVRNIIDTGNPVYPFFYRVFKGKNWDAFSDRIYRNQQQTFGAGREMQTADRPYTANPLDPARLGDAILGLAYQPGRYADPAPTFGLGFPFVSLGAIPLAALLAWLFSGRARRFEGVVAASILLSLAMWFVLSEQSRYILGLAFPLCVLAGGVVSRLRIGPLFAAAAAIQFLAAIAVLTKYTPTGWETSLFSQKLRVVLGLESSDDYLAQHVGFYKPAQDLNTMARGGRVALYDEVFGYFLDVPYFWANPGHSTQMGYEQMQNADQLVAAFDRLGITYVYINLGETFGGNPQEADTWMQAAGLNGAPVPYSPADRARRMIDPQDKYKVLLAEAIAAHLLTPVGQYKSGLILSVTQASR